jgi:hypothetical protein
MMCLLKVASNIIEALYTCLRHLWIIITDVRLTYAVLVIIRAVTGENVQAMRKHNVLMRQVQAAIRKNVTGFARSTCSAFTRCLSTSVAHSAACITVS